MPKTYYDSELTAEQIEDALTAIDGVVNPGNNGKVLYIENGQIKAASASRWSGGYPEPTGTIQITQNGTVNVKDYASAEVNVSGGGSAVIQPLSVTQNGTYNPPSGVDGYAPVTVNVSGGGDDPFALKNYIESSGTQYIDTGYIANATTKLELVIALSTTLAEYAALFGARNGAYATANKVFTAYRVSSEIQFFVGQGAYKKETDFTVYQGQKAKWVLDKNSCGVVGADGVNYYGTTFNSGAVDDENSIYLLTFNQNGTTLQSTMCAGKVYRFRIYEGDVLVHEFIPWQENGVACFKDTITSAIKYNAGTGNFVYGTDA